MTRPVPSDAGYHPGGIAAAVAGVPAVAETSWGLLRRPAMNKPIPRHISRKSGSRRVYASVFVCVCVTRADAWGESTARVRGRFRWWMDVVWPTQSYEWVPEVPGELTCCPLRNLSSSRRYMWPRPPTGQPRYSFGHLPRGGRSNSSRTEEAASLLLTLGNLPTSLHASALAMLAYQVLIS